LLVSVNSLCWEINLALGLGDEEDAGFKRHSPMCAARPLVRRDSMEMFDTILQTTIKADGKAQVKTLFDESDLPAMEFAKACEEEYVRAAKRFEKIDRIAKAQQGIPDNLCEWFDSMEAQYVADKRLWLMFVGADRSRRSNLLYCEYRRMLLSGKKLRADA
jgi:hypothetical protein